jgi:L-ascorbate metabolism protein UlaG (beta-lactamase superfamily)
MRDINVRSPRSASGGVLLRVLLLILVLSGLLASLFLAYALSVYDDAPVDPQWLVNGTAHIPDGAVTVRFSGTATLLFSDGETQWMTDGWFTRPGPLRLLFGKIGPDLQAIEQGLAHNHVTQLVAVLPVHSHYDHAMDAPQVARRTGAVLLGSQSTANIGRGWGLPESQIHVLIDRQPVRLGKFVITPIESRHFEFPDPVIRERALGNPLIEAPLVPPVRAFDYRVGKAYVLHVSHPKGSWLIAGSAGYVEGALQGLSADTVFLGVGGLGSQSADYLENFWRETVTAVTPSRIIPVHFDSLTAPVAGPFKGQIKAMALLSSDRDNTLSFLRDKQAAHPELHFMTLPRFEEVVLFE